MGLISLFNSGIEVKLSLIGILKQSGSSSTRLTKWISWGTAEVERTTIKTWGGGDFLNKVDHNICPKRVTRDIFHSGTDVQLKTGNGGRAEQPWQPLPAAAGFLMFIGREKEKKKKNAPTVASRWINFARYENIGLMAFI